MLKQIQGLSSHVQSGTGTKLMPANPWLGRSQNLTPDGHSASWILAFSDLPRMKGIACLDAHIKRAAVLRRYEDFVSLPDHHDFDPPLTINIKQQDLRHKMTLD
jgi:hypothetical protein